MSRITRKELSTSFEHRDWRIQHLISFHLWPTNHLISRLLLFKKINRSAFAREGNDMAPLIALDSNDRHPLTFACSRRNTKIQIAFRRRARWLKRSTN